MAGLTRKLSIAGLEVANAIETPLSSHCGLLRWWSVSPDHGCLRGELMSLAPWWHPF